MRNVMMVLGGLCLSMVQAAAADPVVVPDPLAAQWRVEIIGFVTKADTPPATIEIKPDGTFSGFSGCNRYSGGFTVAANTITFAAPALTKMMCAPAAMEQETQFFSLLNGGLSWKSEGANNVLLAKDTQAVMRLVPPTQQADVTIRIPGAETVARNTVRYSCSGRIVSAEYLNAGLISIVSLTIGDEFVLAANVLSGSGAKYAGGRYIWWAKGAEATLYDLQNGDNSDGVTCSPAP